MPPGWLETIAWAALAIAFACAAIIAADIFLRGYRQPMWIMEIVWPVTALYLGPLAVWGYARWGRPKSPRWQERFGEPAETSEGASVAVGVSHCGAGCTLGDILGAWLVLALGLELSDWPYRSNTASTSCWRSLSA